ncbi:MAG: hypothetical protein KJ063_24180, partial [Anaerolineae bacterium]|nr:hypothetical protein [Anaerolineae bacterium]
PALAEQDFGQTGAFRSHLPRPALAEQDFGQTGAFRSHLSRPALAETEGVKGVRQAGIRLNRLTRMVARLSHPYHGF